MTRSLASWVDSHAREQPNSTAFVCGAEQLSWAEYSERSSRLAGDLLELGLEAGQRVAVLLPDGPGVHVAFVGVEKAGGVTVGIGPRAGRAEIRHLLERTGASILLSPVRHRDLDLEGLFGELCAEGLPLKRHVIVEGQLCGTRAALPARSPELEQRLEQTRLGPEDLFFLNSTSGTTGLPKCVTHHQGRWFYFHKLACETGALSERDVFLSALPAPFGFGLWTAHVTPTLLGAPTVLLERFDADELVRAIEEHRVSVLAAVSTQFIMMLNSPELDRRDLSSLRALYTGGEAGPYERAVEFEERTGAVVLQFYGSNETGALSGTRLDDSRERRLRSAGRTIAGMNVRLFDDAGRDVTASGVGQPACRGPATSRGYYADDEANRALYTADGWMLTGDIATLDDEGYLRVIGRTADFIIRGGKNISGPAVEEAVGTHPDVALAAAVAMPDPVYGERVCVYVELRRGTTLTLEELQKHLAARGISKETFPERLIAVDTLPRSSGDKVAKGELKADIRRRLEQETS